MKFFSPDSPFSRALSFVGDLIILNFLFIICCIPVITIGASSAALYTVAMRMADNDDRGTVKPFFKAFKDNFKKATVLWLIFLAAGMTIALGASVIILNPGAFQWFVRSGYILVIILFLVDFSWAFPLQAKFENSVTGTIKNAFIIGITRPVKTAAVIVLMLIPIVMAVCFTYYFLVTGFIWAMFGFSGIAVLQSMLINKGLRPFLERQEESAEPDDISSGISE